MASQVFGGAIEDSAEFVVFRDNETTQVIGDNPSVPGTLLEVMSLPAGVLQSDGDVHSSMQSPSKSRAQREPVGQALSEQNAVQ